MIKKKFYNKKGVMAKHKLIFVLLPIYLITIILTGCQPAINNDKKDVDSQFISKSAFLLNTFISISIYDKQEEAILDQCMELIKKYEKIFSRTDPESELYAINNQTAPHEGLTYYISDEMSELIAYGLYYSKLSDGAFDISIAPVSSLWDFTGINPRLPSKEEINKALAYIDYKNIHLEGNKLTLAREGIRLDLGAIAKGYIADKVKEYLLSQGVNSAIINLGGNVLCLGTKPDGSYFKVGIQKPYADRNETIAIMEINDMSVVSSGVYERYFTFEGNNYHHILNPKTGYPYNNNLISVSIISKASVDGDGLSTSCFALGLDEGIKLLESIPDTYGIFITSDYEVHYTKGFKEAITLIE
ncbi:FAD:protein FMN transferase [Herbinix luporum]|jgi:thiamine biosynthesis lipoprotein|uniref:FAD:protein FMN transferase n=1 Tax=Herbinix luporum TaxID=1679721 RepID=UPI00175D5D33|nr:FAD:protein FMN transferase [Herbinix luporum]HHT56803.1 FAD:protein FMN transferase [Herbinix luporum]